jgi:succinyl-diaminopimelate desuccinylase
MTCQKYINEHTDELVSLLRELIAFPSVLGEAKEDAPFGVHVKRCYEFMQAKAEADGFDFLDVNGYGGHIDWPGAERDETGEITGPAKAVLGIPVHIDVVPAGEGWSYDPFGAEVIDGRIYGRGTTDNKCSVAAVYTALLALRANGFQPASTIRLMLGLDEETGWRGMVKYLETVPAPDFGFSPDADFPAINGEMGIIDFELAKKLRKTSEKGVILRSIDGGSASNMVPDKARAIIMDEVNKNFDHIKEKLAAFREETGYHVNGKGVGKAFEITAHGVSAHGAHPELGVNAISVLMKFLGELEVANESIREFLGFYNTHLGFELHGEQMDIGFEDEASGRLILNVGLVSMDAEAVIVTINVRYPVTLTEGQVYDSLMPLIHRNDLGIVKLGHNPPIFFPPDSPFIETLMSVYREHTGDEANGPVVIGGGTYARAIPNAVAFGPRFPGEPDLMHQKDEYITTDDLVKITEIYADAIRRLAG